MWSRKRSTASSSGSRRAIPGLDGASRDRAIIYRGLQSRPGAAIVQVRVDLSPEAIRRILIYVLVLVASVAFHEFGHAFMADRLGDDTPRRQGRVTLKPIAPADPIGTLLLPLIRGIYAALYGVVPGIQMSFIVSWVSDTR